MDGDGVFDQITTFTFDERDNRTSQSFVDSLSQQGLSMVYEEIHKVLGCGSSVAALSKMKLGDTDMAVIDLFRVDDGRIVEHWDVMEEIQPRETWVNSGKF